VLSTVVHASRCALLLLYTLLYDIECELQGSSARLPPDNYSSLALASSSRGQRAIWPITTLTPS